MLSVPSPPVEPGKASEHEGLAVAAIAQAYREVPFYSGRPALPARASLARTLAAIPLLWKTEVRSALPRRWVAAERDVKAELASGDLELVETSGSTADRTRILWDKGWWLHQEERGVRTNPVVARAMDGALGAYREAILTTPACGLGLCHTGDLPFEERRDGRWLFLNMRPDPAFWQPEDMTRMLDEIARHETVGLEADPGYLAALARHAERTGRSLDVKGFVTLTYSLASAAHLRAIHKVTKVPLFHLYGASEVGVLFMEGADRLLHHCPRTTHVELLPLRGETPESSPLGLVVVTTLDRKAMPLVRFVLGDLVRLAPAAKGRFTDVPPLASVEGRWQDAVLRPDGALVTAGAIDRALAPLEVILEYQVNQTTRDEVTVDVVPVPGAPPGLLPDVRDGLAPLLSGLRVSARVATAVSAEGSGKMRLVRRHFACDLGSFVSECAGVSL